MAIRENAFSPEKALESVLLIASSLNEPTVHEVLKMRYFADKIHFSEYGFLGSGDRYVAMSFGPESCPFRFPSRKTSCLR